MSMSLVSKHSGFLLLISLCVAAPAVSQDSAQLEALFWARKDSALTRFSQADVDFMNGMIAHHAQALIMSSFAETNQASSSIRVLAARIINAQNDEIRIMKSWLRKRNQPVPEIRIEGRSLMIHSTDHAAHTDHADHGTDHADHMDHGSGHHGSGMPGMLTDSQLKELEMATGAEFDRLFLEYMIMHHEGAVYMVRELFDTDGAVTGDDTYKLAADIHVDQLTEIDRMKLILERFETLH